MARAHLKVKKEQEKTILEITTHKEKKSILITKESMQEVKKLLETFLEDLEKELTFKDFNFKQEQIILANHIIKGIKKNIKKKEVKCPILVKGPLKKIEMYEPCHKLNKGIKLTEIIDYSEWERREYAKQNIAENPTSEEAMKILVKAIAYKNKDNS